MEAVARPQIAPSVGQSAAKTGLQVAVKREITIAAPLEDVFDFLCAEDVLPKILTGYGLIPAVVSTSGNTGPWDTSGSVRTVHLADGSSAREEVTDYIRPGYFAYKVSEPTFVLKHLIQVACGQFWFDATSEGTRITWIYTFTAKNALTRIPLYAFANTQWAGFMDVCLEKTAAHFG